MPAGAEVVYSTAVGPENPERQAAAGRELHRAELLAQIAALKRCIAVTGTHGKTTTTAMVVHALRGAGADPAYVVGGELRSTGSNAGWGAGEWIVIEADESDRSLLSLDPDIAVLTNAELDHHSTYASLHELEDTFRTFVARAATASAVWDRPALRALCPPDAVPYDATELGARPRRARGSTSAGREVALAGPGGPQRGQCRRSADRLRAGRRGSRRAPRRRSPTSAAPAGGSSRSGGRRAGAAVLDDYAHHPTEVAAAIAAARTLAPRRLVAVFQPHLFSRTRALATRVRPRAGGRRRGGGAAGLPGPRARRGLPRGRRAADRHRGRRRRRRADGGLAARLRARADAGSRRRSRAGDICLVMGAGDVDRLGRSLVVPA